MTTPTNSSPVTPPPARGRRVAILVLLLVALAAGLAGVAVDRLVLLPRHAAAHGPGGRAGGPMRRPPHEREREFRDRMARELELSDSQRVRIDSLMEQQLREVRAVRQATEPRLDSIIEGTRSRIDSILTAAQREKARAMARRDFHGPGHHRGPPRDGWEPGPPGPPR